jgi:hypothetical protein
MTLTVRLDSTLASALDRYCTERGVTKSLVVQESLATYLLAGPAPMGAARAARPGSDASPVSANFRALAEAGLIGGVALGHGADKSAVRARVTESVARRKARTGGA